jgi:hypothetical protein
MPDLFDRALTLVGVVVAAVGLVDGVRSHEPDLTLLCAVMAVLFITLLARSAWGQQRVPVRRDLAQWLARRAALEGEPVEQLANRSLAAHQAALEAPTRRGSRPSVMGGDDGRDV